MVAVGGIRMRGKVFLTVILTVAALLFCFPAHAQERAGCLVTATVEEAGGQTEGQEEAGKTSPTPSPPVMASPQTGEEDNNVLIGPPEQNGGAEVFWDVNPRSVCGWPMLLLFLLLLLLLCLIAWLAGRKTDRGQRENVREK